MHLAPRGAPDDLVPHIDDVEEFLAHRGRWLSLNWPRVERVVPNALFGSDRDSTQAEVISVLGSTRSTFWAWGVTSLIAAGLYFAGRSCPFVSPAENFSFPWPKLTSARSPRS